MIKIAIIGYESDTRGMKAPFPPCEFFPETIESWQRTHEVNGVAFCDTEAYDRILDPFTLADIDGLVERMLATDPDVVHYANYHDTYSRRQTPATQDFDRRYLETVIHFSTRDTGVTIPILLTSSSPHAHNLANDLLITRADMNELSPERYLALVKQMAGRYRDLRNRFEPSPIRAD